MNIVVADPTGPDVWSMVGAVGAIVAGVAALVAAIAAIRAARFTWTQIEDNRDFNRTRLTIDVFAFPDIARLTTFINGVVAGMGTLVRARGQLNEEGQFRALNREEKLNIQDCIGMMSYLGVLYREKVLDDNIFIPRAAPFMASGFYMLQDKVANYLRCGSIDRTIIPLAQDCLKYYQQMQRQYEPWPELVGYTIPDDFPGPPPDDSPF